MSLDEGYISSRKKESVWWYFSHQSICSILKQDSFYNSKFILEENAIIHSEIKTYFDFYISVINYRNSDIQFQEDKLE